LNESFLSVLVFEVFRVVQGAWGKWLRSGFEGRGGCGGQVKVEVDRHMICETGGERIAEYFALLDQRDMMFSDEIVVKDRVGVRFSEEGVGLKGGRRDRKAAISDNKFERIDHIQE